MNDLPLNAHPDLQRAVIFHGHFCPGLAIGYRATQIAMDALGTGRAEDEGLVAIVENDSCAVDAVQVLAGCTFGKGNLIFRDHGKHVYTFALRPSGQAVRLSLRPRDEADRTEMSRDEQAQWFLEADLEKVFVVQRTTIDLPPKAEIRRSMLCEACGEPVMDTRARRVNGRTLCRPCAETAP